MQITPVSYNYTNKTQKNNSKPAFGMAMTKGMEEYILRHSEQIIRLGAEGKQSLLNNITKIRTHALRVDCPPTHGLRILSPEGKLAHPVQGETYDVLLDKAARALDEHDSLQINCRNKKALVSDRESDLSTSRQTEAASKVKMGKDLISGEINNQAQCQTALMNLHALGQNVADDETALRQARVDNTDAIKKLGEFFSETVKPEKAE